MSTDPPDPRESQAKPKFQGRNWGIPLAGNYLCQIQCKYSVNPWLQVVTRLSLFGCDEPSSTEPRWIVATTG